MNDNEGRSGVLIRGVTRGVQQKDLLRLLKTQSQYKENHEASMNHKDCPDSRAVDESQIPSLPDKEILSRLRVQVLSGAYQLINYESYIGYEPGDNVVQIFAMGSPWNRGY